uniref:acetate--CoA ligase n=1 Tax=Plectus sambesii TaxID=2011161 RepID=A0A914WKB8_9BILA
MSPAAPTEPPASPTPDNTRRNVQSAEHYAELQRAGLANPDAFWRAAAKQLYFESPLPDAGNLLNFNFNSDNGAPFVSFVEGAKTNVCYNCIDRFMLDRDGPDVEGVRVPKRNFNYKFYWEGNYWDEPTHDYAELTWETFQIVVKKCANILKSKGVQRGDRVLLYLPMVFQLPVAMLACARIGAVHVNVPGGMSAEGLAQRVVLSGAELIITVDGFWRGTKLIKAKETVDRAIALCKERGHEVKLTLMISHLSPNPGTPPPEAHEQFIGRRPCYFLNAPFNPEQDEWWADNFCKASPVCDVEWMDAEDPLFISLHQC